MYKRTCLADTHKKAQSADPAWGLTRSKGSSRLSNRPQPRTPPSKKYQKMQKRGRKRLCTGSHGEPRGATGSHGETDHEATLDRHFAGTQEPHRYDKNHTHNNWCAYNMATTTGTGARRRAAPPPPLQAVCKRRPVGRRGAPAAAAVGGRRAGRRRRGRRAAAAAKGGVAGEHRPLPPRPPHEHRVGGEEHRQRRRKVGGRRGKTQPGRPQQPSGGRGSGRSTRSVARKPHGTGRGTKHATRAVTSNGAAPQASDRQYQGSSTAQPTPTPGRHPP